MNDHNLARILLSKYHIRDCQYFFGEPVICGVARLMKKLGLTYEKEVHVYDEDAVYYASISPTGLK